MWPLPSPSISTDEILDACVAGMQNRDLIRRLLVRCAELDVMHDRFELHVDKSETHALQPADFNVPGVSLEEMVWIYDERLARGPRPGRPSSRGRHIYDQIMASAEYGRCPTCGTRFVTEMDHFLPKTLFAGLTVCPFNLVPICSGCNFTKRNKIASRPEEEFFHPYGPSWDRHTWLVADVSVESPPLVEFKVGKPTAWSEADFARVEEHFERFGLGLLYTMSAISHMASISGYLERLSIEGDATSIRSFLLDQEASFRRVRNNNWEAAMFSALARSDDYCSGLFGFGPPS